MIHKSEITGFSKVTHNTGLCVVGGGLAGLFAAVSAARHGQKVVLMGDRPVLGGNASSEIRMWVRGARGTDKNETGLIEEAALENIRSNPTLNFSQWDAVLYNMAVSEPNITLLLNCSCLDAEMSEDGKQIVSVTGWQTTTQKFHCVYAKIFADCSGDSVLAPLTGAEYRMGRESREEFGEDIAPEQSDNHTMGMSCLLQARETDRPVSFKAPDFANKYTPDNPPPRLGRGSRTAWQGDNFWWIEIGGMFDSIGDTELMREKLLPVTLGIWDYIKNSGEYDSENWELDWVGFLPGKRESRRYVGDHILTQHDVRAEGRFDDIIAYGGWSMDDHHPAGMETTEPPTIFHPAPSPYGIPYRCIYSKNIENLMFAGRNISVTHAAVSSSRVMGTCAILGQALGTAAALALEKNISPRGVFSHIDELKQCLMRDDCFLPFNRYKISALTESAKIECTNGADTSLLTNGYTRTCETEDGSVKDNLFLCGIGDSITLTLPEKTHIDSLRMILDSDINRDSFEGISSYTKDFPMLCNRRLSTPHVFVPKTIAKSYTVEVFDGEWKTVYKTDSNYQRLQKISINADAEKVRVTFSETNGSDRVGIYEIEIM